MKPITIVQIARALGVSPATISNAYHHPERLSAALREKVFSTAERLGFSGPNPSASSLRTGRINVIGVVYYDRLSFAFTDPGNVLFLEGVAQTLEPYGFALTLLSGVRSAEQASARIRQSPVDGYIIYSMSPREPLVEQVKRTHAPLVFVDQSADPTRRFVGIEDRRGAHLAARHLASLGHRKIGIASLEMDIGGAGTMAGAARVRDCVMPMVTARLRGYRSGVHQSTRAASIPIYECKEAVMDEGRRAFQEIMAAQPRTTAILAMSDLLAIGVIEEARNQGLHVPDDLSVVGFDDIHLAANIDPPLTTIRQPHVDKGRTAARMLLDQIETGVVKKPKIFPVELVVRKSTALVSASRARAKEASRVTGS